MREMDFLNGIQNPWSNVTVRRGYKWANLQIGEKIEITDKGESIGLEATVVQITIKRFNKIKHEELRRVHDPMCRARKGLLRAMKLAYPTFTETEPVTMVTYVVRKAIK